MECRLDCQNFLALVLIVRVSYRPLVLLFFGLPFLQLLRQKSQAENWIFTWPEGSVDSCTSQFQDQLTLTYRVQAIESRLQAIESRLQSLESTLWSLGYGVQARLLELFSSGVDCKGQLQTSGLVIFRFTISAAFKTKKLG